MSEDNPFHMWTYLRDMHGHIYALQHCYPDLLKRSLDLQQALAQLRNAERAIDAIMAELAEDEAEE